MCGASCGSGGAHARQAAAGGARPSASSSGRRGGRGAAPAAIAMGRGTAPTAVKAGQLRLQLPWWSNRDPFQLHLAPHLTRGDDGSDSARGGCGGFLEILAVAGEPELGVAWTEERSSPSTSLQIDQGKRRIAAPTPRHAGTVGYQPKPLRDRICCCSFPSEGLAAHLETMLSLPAAHQAVAQLPLMVIPADGLYSTLLQIHFYQIQTQLLILHNTFEPETKDGPPLKLYSTKENTLEQQ